MKKILINTGYSSGTATNIKEKYYFWKLFLRTINRRPSLKSEAMTYSLDGYHFRTVLFTGKEDINSD